MTKRQRLTGTALLAPCLLMFLVFTVIPTGRAVVLSLCDAGARHMRFIGLGNYIELASDPAFWEILGRTLVYAAICAPVLTVMPAILAFIAHTGSERYGTVVRVTFYLPAVAAGAVMGSIWRWMLNADVGVINSILGRVGIAPIAWLGSIPWAFVSVCVVLIASGQGAGLCIYMAALSVVKKETLEAARIDWCSDTQVARHILWLALLPVILTMLLLNTVGTFQIWQLIKIMTGGGPMESTMSIVLWMYEVGFGQNRIGYASAVGVLMVLPIGVPILLKQRALWGDRK